MITLREALPGDEAFLVGLVPRFVEHGVAGGHSRDEVVEGTARVLREALAARRPDEVVLIAETDGGRPAGFVYGVTQRDFFTAQPYLHVSEIATVESGCGVGSLLMDGAETWARERGYRFVTLNVVDENRAAQRFYERRGFAIGHHQYVRRLENPP